MFFDYYFLPSIWLHERRFSAPLLGILLSVSLIFIAGFDTVMAKDTLVSNQSQSSQPTARSSNSLWVTVGGFGAVNGSFITQPNDKIFTPPESPNTRIDIPYPGFGGVGGGGGLRVELGWRALSLGLGYTLSADQADGRLNGQTFTLSQTTHHLPLILRAELPSDSVRPSLFGGPEWVFASTPTLEIPTLFQGSVYRGAKAEDYLGWCFGFGFDFMIDTHWRIPLRFKAVYAPYESENIKDYIYFTSNTSTGDQIDFKSAWVWQAQVSLGLSYTFDL